MNFSHKQKKKKKNFINQEPEQIFSIIFNTIF